MDPLEFFDHLANKSVSSFKDQEWYTLKQEKEDLYHWMDQQLQALKELENQADEANDGLNKRMMEKCDVLSSDIQQHQTLLMTEKRQYEKKKRWITKIRQCQDEKIKLNVGGQLFQTSLSTLRKDPQSILAVMFGEPKTIQPDANHSYFRLVLNYLRDSKIPASIINDPKIMDELMQEARFYKLNDLLLLKWQGLPTLTQQELHTIYPVSHEPTLFRLTRRDLSHLDFSRYHIDSRSTFIGSNLAYARFDRAHFDLTYPIDLRDTYLLGTLFPKDLVLQKEGSTL